MHLKGMAWGRGRWAWAGARVRARERERAWVRRLGVEMRNAKELVSLAFAVSVEAQ